MTRTHATRLLGALAVCMALSACGHADNAAQAASADNVEIPAEEALSGVPLNEKPVADASAAPATTPPADGAADAASGAASAP